MAILQILIIISVILHLLFVVITGDIEINRVIGGEKASINEFPHQISLRYEGRHVCGGSIIHELYILTAAHCVHGRDTENFTVVSGSVLLSEGGETHTVDLIKYHEKYSPDTLDNDIAVIKLKRPIIFNKDQKPIKLTKTDTPAGVNVIFSGWGLYLYPGNSYPNNLQKMTVVTHDSQECQKFYNLSLAKIIVPEMLCGFNKIHVGVCKGDSGGPLILSTNQKPIQVGVMSWIWNYCALGVPDVYMRVYSYLDWIHKNAKVNKEKATRKANDSTKKQESLVLLEVIMYFVFYIA